MWKYLARNVKDNANIFLSLRKMAPTRNVSANRNSTGDLFSGMDTAIYLCPIPQLLIKMLILIIVRISKSAVEII